MATPDGLVIINPKITINSISRTVSARRAALTAEPIRGSIETFTLPGAMRAVGSIWTVQIDFVQSYGTDSTWTDFLALANTKQTIEMGPDDSAAATTNPIATFSIYFPQISFMDAGIGEESEFSIEETVLGQPTFATS